MGPTAAPAGARAGQQGWALPGLLLGSGAGPPFSGHRSAGAPSASACRAGLPVLPWQSGGSRVRVSSQRRRGLLPRQHARALPVGPPGAQPCRRWARLCTLALRRLGRQGHPRLCGGTGSCTGGSGRLQVLWQDDAKRAGGVAHGLVGWWVGRLAEDGDRGPGTSCRLRRRHRRRHLGRRSLGPRLDTDAAAELLILATACTRVLDCGGAGGLGRPRRGCPGGVWPR